MQKLHWSLLRHGFPKPQLWAEHNQPKTAHLMEKSVSYTFPNASGIFATPIWQIATSSLSFTPVTFAPPVAQRSFPF